MAAKVVEHYVEAMGFGIIDIQSQMHTSHPTSSAAWSALTSLSFSALICKTEMTMTLPS